MSGQLQQLVARIEHLEDERKNIATDIKEVYAEAKANGFDPKILRKVIAKRKKDAVERQEEEAMIDVYMASLGANVGDVQSFTRKDGVKVTYERTSRTKEIKPIQESASIAPLDGRGETSVASDAPADPITVLPSDSIPPDAAAKAGATLIDQPELSPTTVPVSVEDGVAPADLNEADDLAIPDFLKRTKPQYAAINMMAGGV